MSSTTEVKAALPRRPSLARRVQNAVRRRILEPLVANSLRLRAISRAASASHLEVTERPLLVCMPHQDDETLGCGGLIALKRERGLAVEVIFLSDGRGGHMGGRTDLDALVEERRAEAIAALDILGVPAGSVTFLDLPDGELGDLPPPKHSTAVKHLADRIRSLAPGEICVPHRHDRHADHEASYRLVREALLASGCTATLLECLIWYFWMTARGDGRSNFAEDFDGVSRLPLPPAALTRKHQAIDIYKSQHELLPHGFMANHAQAVELYVSTEVGCV